MLYYICGCDAHFVIHSLVNSVVAGVSTTPQDRFSAHRTDTGDTHTGEQNSPMKELITECASQPNI